MLRKETFFIFILSLLALFLIWYIFIKENDYIITFKVKTATGTVHQGIQDWVAGRKKSNDENYVLVTNQKYNLLKYTLKNDKNTLNYNWEIQPINDSITEIKVGILDCNNSIDNRVTIPFITTDFKEDQLKKITDFKKGLDDHLKDFKVNLVKEGTSSEVYVAYISLKSVMQEKAQTMIANDNIITGYLYQNKIKITGKPYLEITNWDAETEKLDFNYCFPIEKKGALTNDEKVKFKTIPAQKGLTVSYFGNFRTSDRGWFAILDYAKKHQIALDAKPLEHFLANPFNGGNELEWETQIIIPFSKK